MADDHVELAWQERRAAHEVLADALRRRIMLGGFAFGSKLPTERELALGLGVSRNTARRAMRLLAAEGLVSTTRGRSGGSVATVPAVSPRRRKQLLTQWSDTVADAYEYRLALEPLAARWAAERGSAAQGRQLAALVGETPADLGGYHQLDAQLHLLVAAMSGHLLLLEAITRAREEMFREVNTLWLPGAAGAGGLGSFVGFGREHEPVCTAIADRDPEAAHAAMAAHLREARDQFAALVTSFDQGGGG